MRKRRNTHKHTDSDAKAYKDKNEDRQKHTKTHIETAIKTIRHTNTVRERQETQIVHRQTHKRTRTNSETSKHTSMVRERQTKKPNTWSHTKNRQIQT